MAVDRRRHERCDLLGKVRIEADQDREASEPMALYVRDVSDGGLSGTFFGNRCPSAGQQFTAVDQYGRTQPLRVVWSHSSIDTVHMLGFECHGRRPSRLHDFVTPIALGDEPVAS